MTSDPTKKPKLRQRVWGEVRNELTDVAYDDDIQEFDNPIPGWWKGILGAAIAFAFPYVAYFHADAEGRTAAEYYAVAAADNARLQFGTIGELSGDEPTLVKYMNDKSWVAIGKGIFQSNCVACHARDGGGKVGPNLCDEQFKNVDSIEDIYTVISKGAAAGAMPAWKDRMEQNELVLVACYVASLRGSTPAVAKPGEGREIPAWPEYVPMEEPVQDGDASVDVEEPAGT